MSHDQAGGLALPVTDEALARRLGERLEVVEKALQGHVQSRFPYVTETAGHLLAAGGKRFRPLLVLLAAETGDRPDADEVVTAACIVEITHLGSLYHDDVMDEAALRRGADSANVRWDNLVAILTGDFLFARSSELTAQLGAEAVRIQAETFTRLVEGQILETVPPGPGDDPLAHYLEVVAGKTGSLIATSARYGARFSGAGTEVEEALAAYGELVGSAFQLSDDILDIASESVESGKTPGTDLREGVPTLPTLMARASTDPADARLLELLDADLTDDALHAEALGLLRAHPALAQARAYVVAQAQEAKQRLAVLPEGPVRDALEGFADGVATRTA
ncbi:polyprenyl synthetase family protein [Nocardioides sp. SYSU D00038]|uniref:polyprenyl synthetase family protein n=1 Tax=Nocardioides sp. SYSU D00038 TaxID=2812554 RepID=UPI0027DCC5B2|nr:polyprenyl synthetase family protein [Nocardioides sp. SYSU D00038]